MTGEIMGVIGWAEPGILAAEFALYGPNNMLSYPISGERGRFMIPLTTRGTSSEGLP